MSIKLHKEILGSNQCTRQSLTYWHLYTIRNLPVSAYLNVFTIVFPSNAQQEDMYLKRITSFDFHENRSGTEISNCLQSYQYTKLIVKNPPFFEILEKKPN